MTLSIGILGHTGRVGKILVAELESGAHGAVCAGGAAQDDDADALFKKADVLIDFSVPDAATAYAALAAAHKKPLVTGTTGLNEAQQATVAKAAQVTQILQAANMSVGVNLLLALVEQTAARLGPEFDIEIFESHHKNKIDAPSGTALALGRAAQAGRNGGAFVTDRGGKRHAGDIGFATLRGGDVVGEHDVGFYGAGERVILSHKATDRALFARGAIRAALWLPGKAPGLYGMRDVLGL